MKKARPIESSDRKEEYNERRLAADPFYTLGLIRAIADPRRACIPSRRNPAARLSEINATLRSFKVACDAQRAAGKTFFVGFTS